MKVIQEIKFEDLTTRQKLGLVNLALYPEKCSAENEEFIFEQIRARALGAIWIQIGNSEEAVERTRQRIARVREAADYPILIVTDAESGMGDYKIGHHNPIGRTGSEAYAYAFGKSVGVTARRLGYNTVCNPIMDISENGSSRSLGADKHMIAKLAAAEARGMHDAGVLTVGKHYPSPKNDLDIDTHMVEGGSSQTEEELLDYSLYAYIELIREGLLDGLMISHDLLKKIDPELPATLSAPVKNVIRKQGYDGFMVTDALCMMGIRAKHGRVKPMGMAIESGCDFAMMYDSALVFNQEALYECYEKGEISDAALDNAVKRVLAAQSKVLFYDNNRSEGVSEEEDRLARNIEYDSVCAKTDEGFSLGISRTGKHCFAIMVDNAAGLSKDGKVEVDTFSGHWYDPEKIRIFLEQTFPNATIHTFYQFPNQNQCWTLLNKSLGYDEVVFITYSEFVAYTGMEHFTHRVVSVFEAMQHTGRISTLLHFGNPVIIGELPHVPRIIIGGNSAKGISAGLEVLAGMREAKGVLTYHVDFK